MKRLKHLCINKNKRQTRFSPLENPHMNVLLFLEPLNISRMMNDSIFELNNNNNNNNNNNIYDLYRAYTGGSMRHYNDKMKQYIELEVK